MTEVTTAESNESTNKPKIAKPSPKTRSASSKVHWLFSLIIAGGASFVGYQGYLLQQSVSVLSEDSVTSMRALSRQVDSAAAGVSSAEERISENTSSIQVVTQSLAQVDSLQQQINNLTQRVSGASEQERALWQIQELEFLLRMASERILLSHDADSAVALLKAVDRQLTQINRPGVDEVRTAIARDLLSLNMAQQVDTVGLYARVSAIMAKRPELSLNIASHERSDHNASVDTSWWQRALDQIGVRYRVEADTLIVPKSQSYYVGRSVDLMLEESLLALIQGNNELWQMSLSRAARAIEANYVENAISEAIHIELTHLEGVDITPAELNIGAAQTALQAFKLSLSEE